MSAEYEIEVDGKFWCFDAYSTHLNLDVGNLEEGEDDSTMVTFEAADIRQIRRFLEYVYPASEDPPHDPDPWEARSGGVPNSGTTATIPWTLSGALGRLAASDGDNAWQDPWPGGEG